MLSNLFVEWDGIMHEIERERNVDKISEAVIISIFSHELLKMDLI